MERLGNDTQSKVINVHPAEMEQIIAQHTSLGWTYVSSHPVNGRNGEQTFNVSFSRDEMPMVKQQVYNDN